MRRCGVVFRRIVCGGNHLWLHIENSRTRFGHGGAAIAAARIDAKTGSIQATDVLQLQRFDCGVPPHPAKFRERQRRASHRDAADVPATNTHREALMRIYLRTATCVRLIILGSLWLAAMHARGFAGEAENAKAVLPTPPLEKASWIWAGEKDAVCQLRTTLTLSSAPKAASIDITADNGYEVFVNGVLAGFDIGAEGEVWSTVERFDITSKLARGRNVIGIRGTDLGSIRGLIAAVRIERDGEAPLDLVTDAQWHASQEGDPAEYAHPEFVEGPNWTAASVIGPFGMAPWGKLAYAGSTGGRKPRTLISSIAMQKPGDDFAWPESIAFLAEDCSVYVPLRGDAWGVCFRVSDWTRAYTEFDIPCPVKIGRKLLITNPRQTGAAPRLLLDAGKGAIGSPTASFDGKTIFASVALNGDPFFHIYRIPADGSPPQKMTDGPFHDIDPAELPDGRVVFTSTRIGSFEEYHNPPSRALYIMNADGRGIRPITFTPIFDNEPRVMADGRIAFVRTENFFDRAKVETQIHAVRPDGTDGHTEIGAHLGADYGTRLRAFGFGSPAPLPDGRLACISTRGNFISMPGAAEPNYQFLPSGLGDIAPLPDGRLLATVLTTEGVRMASNSIAVIDPRDNAVTCIYKSSSGSVHSPVFVGPRGRPPLLPDFVDPDRTGRPESTGVLNCQNVRFTSKQKADWANIRAVRVLAAMPLTTRSSHSHIVHAGTEVMELGVVPLAPDGSVSVEVPADTPVALQVVDAEGRSELNEMSWIYVRPGERRSCMGCHPARTLTPGFQFTKAESASVPPLKLVGQGNAHRFRGNNSGVTGMMDLQFERFRETASMNRYADGDGSENMARQEIAVQLELLTGGKEPDRISAAQRLGLLRDRSTAAALAKALQDESREVRVAAAMALASCGTRESLSPLLATLTDSDPLVAQAASVALENLTGHSEPFQPFGPAKTRPARAECWKWLASHDCDSIEQDLVRQLDSTDRVAVRRAIVALGHIGGDPARTALRRYLEIQKDKNPYPVFEQDNRTDRFTFDADSPMNPRTLQEAARALGYLKDSAAVPLLRTTIAANSDPRTGNLFLAEACIEALGRIGTTDAETALLESWTGLKDYWNYVGWYSDHPALYACHSSPLHARIIDALEMIGSRRAGPIVAGLIRSVPTDPDRALFPENDAYEMLVGSLIRRSDRREQVIETCLAALGDTQAIAADDLKQTLGAAFPAWAGTPASDNRAAQILSLALRDAKYEPRVRAVYETYRAKAEDPIDRSLGNPAWIPQRHWVLFYLGRALGNLRSQASIDTLLASLAPELNEARHGRPDPTEPNIHFLQLEYTPCWRVTAAWALGQIGDRRALETLRTTLSDLRNAIDVRHAAAEAIGKMAVPEDLAQLTDLARDYPEHSVRLALLRVVRAISPQKPARVAMDNAKTSGTANSREQSLSQK